MILFTYGTLKSGFPRHEILKAEGAEYLGDFVTQDDFYLADINFKGSYGQHFPAMIPTEPPTPSDSLEDKGWHSASIVGEVYELPDRAIALLDSLETSYFRKQINAFQLTNGLGAQVQGTVIREVTAYMMPMGDVLSMLNQIATDWGGMYTPLVVQDYNVADDVQVDWDLDAVAIATPPGGGGGSGSNVIELPSRASVEVEEVEAEIVEGVEGEVFKFTTVEHVPDAIIDKVVVAVAKEEYLSKNPKGNVEGLRQYYNSAKAGIADELGFWLDHINDALATLAVETD